MCEKPQSDEETAAQLVVRLQQSGASLHEALWASIRRSRGQVSLVADLHDGKVRKLDEIFERARYEINEYLDRTRRPLQLMERDAFDFIETMYCDVP